MLTPVGQFTMITITPLVHYKAWDEDSIYYYYGYTLAGACITKLSFLLARHFSLKHYETMATALLEI